MSDLIPARFLGESAQSFPTLGVDGEPGSVHEFTQDEIDGLSPDVWERLDKKPILSGGGLVVTEYVEHVPVTVSVAKASAGSVMFPDGTEILWTSDGATVELTLEQASQLREYTGEFGFDGDPAPARPEPVMLGAEEPAVEEPKAKRGKAPAEPVVEA